MTPNDHYRGRTAPRTSKRCILYIYSTNTYTKYSKHGIYSPFFLFKCSLFHNSNIFCSCFIHILYTECAKIKKKNNSCAKRLSSRLVSSRATCNLSIILHLSTKQTFTDIGAYPIIYCFDSLYHLYKFVLWISLYLLHSDVKILGWWVWWLIVSKMWPHVVWYKLIVINPNAFPNTHGVTSYMAAILIRR